MNITDMTAHTHLPDSARADGAVLIVTLIFVLMLLMLGLSMHGMVMMDAKAARNDGDRQIAFQSAQMALDDAELDIDASPDPARSRSNVFSPWSSAGFSAPCPRGNRHPYQGLCFAVDELIAVHPDDNAGVKPDRSRNAPTGIAMTTIPTMQAWLSNHNEEDAEQSAWVEYGRFSGRSMTFGVATFPQQPPRYIIELIRDPASAAAPASATCPETHSLPDVTASAGGKRTSYLYRITASGFGNNKANQVVLQTIYRKAGPANDTVGVGVATTSSPHAPFPADEHTEQQECPSTSPEPLPNGRLSWKEIANWQEQRKGAHANN